MNRYDWPGGPAQADEGEGDDPMARARFNAVRRNGLPLDAALNAARTSQAPAATAGGRRAPRAPANGRQHLWQSLGPATILGGQAEGNPRVTGRVNALCVHEGGLRLYAAAANGGVWYSNDGGAQWRSVGGLASTNAAGITRPAQRNACGALHVEFGAVEGEDQVFVGTGEVGVGVAGVDFTGAPGSAEGGVGILFGDRPVKSVQPDPWRREAPNLIGDGVYRIARDPTAGGTLLAATLTGLYQRPAAPATDVDWVRPTGTPFATLAQPCSDLLWTPAQGTAPARCWVWVVSGANAGLWVRATGEANFAKVAIDAAAGMAYSATRASLVASTPPTQVWLFNDPGGGAATAGLFRVTNPAAGTAPVAHGVVKVPNVLATQGGYDIAVAVDPAQPNRIVIGGSLVMSQTLDGQHTQWNAAITVADVAPDPGNANLLTFGLAAAPLEIGGGAHPDVHALAFSNAGATLWTGTDGGVYRSDRPTRPAGFYARNHGLTIAESNFVAGHPQADGHLIAGLQDNGTVQRLSSSVWRMKYMGDGGGVILNAANPAQSMAQYVQGSWNVDGGAGTGPMVRGAATHTVESDGSAFYSMPACIAHTRAAPPAAAANFSQTLIGTFRLWYSDDFGVSWVTLPTGTDPLAGIGAMVPVANNAQDALGQVIEVCRWQGPDVAWVLCAQRIRRYARTPGSHDAGGPGAWTARDVMPAGPVATGKVKKRPAAPPSLLDSATWTDIAPNLDPPPAAGQPPAQRGTLGAVYVGTVGHPTQATADTLWWFDGTDQWHATGLRAVVPAPVLSIACSPAAPAEVWVGTTVGVWRGTRTDHGAAAPTWAWEQRVNGLPEAAVEDLALYAANGVTLLRAAIASRGIWELRLDTADVQDLTYLRSHEDDLRHAVPPLVTPPVGNQRVLKKRDGVTDRSWHASPDIRPRQAPVALAAPSTLPWQRTAFTGTTGQLRRFQAALRSSTGDPRIVANGRWDVYFSEVLRDHGVPVLAVPQVPPLPVLSMASITAAFWNTHMTGVHATREPWGTGTPTEADLYELTPDIPEGDVGATSCTLKRGALKVDVVVHHRGLDARDGANVRVTLLKWIDPKPHHRAKWNDTATWFTGAVPWTAAVNEVLNSAAGSTAQPLGPGWSFVGSTDATRRQTLTGQTLDATTSGVASFDLVTGPLANNRVVLLVAVIRAGADVALAPATLQELALTRPELSVRSLRVTTT